jgi:TatA/E family protein of Tat protein translocase
MRVSTPANLGRFGPCFEENRMDCLFGILGMGGQEIVILVLIGALLFGFHKLPHLGRLIGKTGREFRQGLSGIEDAVETVPAAIQPEPSPPRRLTSPSFSE